MAETDRKSDADPQPTQVRGAAEVIFASAIEAFGSAFLLWILGGVAISIAASFARDMIPSLPPGFGAQGASAGHQTGSDRSWWDAVRGSALGLFFAIFFVHSLWVGLHGGGVGPGRRIQRLLSNLRENWFGLIVGNAISAWVAILLLGIAQNFSFTQILWHSVSEMVLPAIRQTGRFFFGESGWASLGGWFSWYGDNQMKLDFWIIYLGGAFDDLGVPNFKTLARRAWRRIQKRKELALPAPAE
jgi:hypothetical protein